MLQGRKRAPPASTEPSGWSARHVEGVLQELDLPAEGRLRHVEPYGGAAEVQFFRDGNKATQLVQLEHRCANGIGRSPTEPTRIRALRPSFWRRSHWAIMANSAPGSRATYLARYPRRSRAHHARQAITTFARRSVLPPQPHQRRRGRARGSRSGRPGSPAGPDSVLRTGEASDRCPISNARASDPCPCVVSRRGDGTTVRRPRPVIDLGSASTNTNFDMDTHWCFSYQRESTGPRIVRPTACNGVDSRA